MKKISVIIFTLMALTIALSAFQLSSAVSAIVLKDTITLIIPKNFPKPLYDIKITDKGFALGKTLFYDPGLSANGSVSCANCHQASAAFANLNSALSKGINDCKGTRNAPPLFNMAWQKSYMWDGRLNNMTAVPLNALTSPCEMGTSIGELIKKLKQTPHYPDLFYKAFGSKEITKEKILGALSQFTTMLISVNSKYDRVIRKEGNMAFTEKEQAGYHLFKEKCSSCHTEPLFTDQSYRNNGLELRSRDIGRDSLTHNKADIGKFRVPSLRNIEITGPYMHDGRFYSLKEVLKHYNIGMQQHANLDRTFKKDGKIGIQMTDEEQTQVIAFLKTLTDVDFINDRRFNNH